MIAIYCRVSTVKQGEKYSLSSQKKSGIKFAESQGQSYKIYEEIESAATIVKRDILKNLLNDIKKNLITSIWVIEFSRISRSVEDCISLKKFFNKYNVQLFENGRPFDLNMADQNLLFNISASLSEYERTIKRERVKRGRKEAIDRGRQVFPLLFGYKKIYEPDGTIKYNIDEKQAKVIRYIYKLYKEEKKSLYSIQHLLNELHIKSSKGKRWYINTVRRVLLHPIYTGYYYNTEGELIKSKLYNPIIELEDFIEIKKNFKKVAYPCNYRKGAKHQSSGLFKCAFCGESYKIDRTNGYYYKNGEKRRLTNYKHLVYYRAKHNQKCPNSRTGYRKKQFDEITRMIFYYFYIRWDQAKTYYEKKVNESRKLDEEKLLIKENYKNLLKKLNTKKENLINAISEGILQLDDARRKMQEIKDEIKSIEEKLNEITLTSEQLVKEYQEIVEDLAKSDLGKFYKANEQKRQRMLKMIIKNGVIENDTLKIEYITEVKLEFELFYMDETIENFKEYVQNRNRA